MANQARKIGPKNRSMSRPTDTTERNASETVENAVAALAYQIWQERGCPIGSDQEDWFRAEEDLKNLAKVPTAT